MSRIVLADPHGCLKTLQALAAKFPEGVPVTVAGDLIDRGPDSRGVVNFILDKGWDVVMGNHELMMLEEAKVIPGGELMPERIYVDNYNGIWTMNGGDACLRSYRDFKPYDEETAKMFGRKGDWFTDLETFKKHFQWMRGLPPFIEYKDVKNANGDYLMVSHSTASRHWAEKDQNAQKWNQFVQTTIWDRNPMPPKIPGVYNIYGHTPQIGGPTVKEHFACVDGGCYLKKDARFGKMYAIMFPEMTIFEQENLE